jgi:hypothetical protein
MREASSPTAKSRMKNTSKHAFAILFMTIRL